MHLFKSIVKLYSDLGGSLVYSCVVSLSFTVDTSVGKQLEGSAGVKFKSRLEH